MKKWRCTSCGYVHSGDAPPDPCPVCHVYASQKPGPLFVQLKQ